MASISLGNIKFIPCDVIGSIFLAMAVINLIRYFGDDKTVPAEGADGPMKGAPPRDAAVEPEAVN